MPSRSSSGRRGGASRPDPAHRTGPPVPPRPCVIDLPGWREPVELLGRLNPGRRPALLCSAALSGETGRYSVLAADPVLTVSWRGGEGVIEGPDGTERTDSDDPFGLLESLVLRGRSLQADPWPFPGGAIGCFSYDAGRALERMPEIAADDRSFPWMDFAFYSWAINWDHLTRRWAALAIPGPAGATRDAGGSARRLCERAAAWALESGPLTAAGPARRIRVPGGEPRLSASLSREGYLAAVGEIRRLITAGDCYEVNLTRRLTAVGGEVDPVRLFSELLSRNPAPFAAYVEGDRGVLVGSSPERYLQVRDGRAETRPIKGTARRAPDAEGDLRAARELKASAKNRAENVMIVDLARNDLGRICAPGTIRVDDLCRLESYAGLHHLVSVVAGRLEPGAGAMDAARALFPPGSMTGAPKIRAMEIIERLEPVRRGPYAGVAGYLSAAGDLDLSVVIRSFLLSEHGADLQVGGAVVADSDPESEFEESVLKSEKALEALGAAGGRAARGASAGRGRDG